MYSRHPVLVRVLLSGLLLVPAVSARAQQDPPAVGDEAALVAVLQSDAPLFDKAKACQQLAIVGTKEAVPVLAGLLADQQLGHYARFALEPIPDAAVDAALRASLGQLEGGLLVGVINSIGMRRDTQAIEALEGLLGNADTAVAGAAACALGRIASPAAIDILTAALAAADPVRRAVADGCLTAADTLEKGGQLDAAQSIYDAMRAAELPKFLQIAALAGAIRARGAQGVDLLVEQLQSADDEFFEVGLSMAHLIPGERITETLIAEVSKPLPAPESDGPVLMITKAEYGAQDTWADVTQALTDAVQAGRASAEDTNELLGGDPVPRVVKQLRVSYTLGGEPRQVEIPENGEFEVAGVPMPSNPRATSVVTVLAQRGDRAALPVILQLAADGPWDVRLAALRALAKLGDVSAVPLLLEVAATGQGASATVALDSLADLPDRAADARLEALLDDSAGTQQLVIIELLGRREIASAVPALLKLVSNDDKAVRDAAFAALGLTVDLNQLATLVTHLVKPASPDVAAAAKGALQKATLRMPDRDAAARVLIDHLPTASEQSQADLLELLGLVGGEQALACVVAAAEDSDERLQDAATQVLGRWTSPDAAPALLKLTKAAGNRYKVRTLRGYIRIARQLNVPTEQRIEMCQTALGLADRTEDRQLIVETLGRYPTTTSLALVAAQLDQPALAESAAAAAVAIGQKLVNQEPAEVAQVMQQVLAGPASDDLKQKATRLLDQAKGK